MSYVSERYDSNRSKFTRSKTNHPLIISNDVFNLFNKLELNFLDSIIDMRSSNNFENMGTHVRRYTSR